MAYQQITDWNMTEGLHTPFMYANYVSGGLFINMLFIVIFTVVTLGVFFYQKRTTGDGDIFMAGTVGGITTLVSVTLAGLVDNLVQGYVYAIVIVVTLVFFLMFLFLKRDY